MKKLIASVLALALSVGQVFAQALPSTPSGNVLGNSTAATRNARPEALTLILDRAFGSARGSIIQRGASSWQVLTPGTSGFALTSAGPGADLIWAAAASTPAALTKTDDTNVTLTLSGSPATALLQAVGLQLGWTGTLAATRGGTGNGSYAVGDLLQANTTTTLARLAAVATGNVLISGGVGTVSAWGKVTSSHLNITTTTCTNQVLTAISASVGGTCSNITLAMMPNLGTTTTVLHGNAAGNPSFGAVVSADLNITTTTCTTGQFINAISSGGVGTCLTARELLTANRTYFVRTDGSNSNTGLVNSAGGAFLTPQKCYDVIAALLDLGGFTVTCSLVNTSSPSTFTSGVAITQPWTGGGAVTFAGSTGTATDVVVSTTSAHAFSTTGSLPGTLTIKDMKIQTTTSGDGIFHQATGLVQFSNLNFGAIVGAQLDAVGSGVNLEATSNYTISGGGGTHVIASRPSNVSIRNKTITLSGTPAFTNNFALAANGGVIAIDGNTFSGAASAGTSRFNVQNGGQIYTGTSGSAAYLPGGTAGTGTNYGASPWGLYN